MRALLLVIAGCSYSPKAAGNDAPPDDSAIEGDGPGIDAPTITPCTVASSGAPVASDPVFIGGTGGNVKTDATCAANELPIGLWFHVSSNPIPDHANQVAMVDLHMRCGRITRGTDGVFTTTAMERVDSTGGVGGNCSAYFPNAETAEATCPAGRVIVGVAGNRLDDTLYNSVVLQCAALDASGAITSDVVQQAITGTGAHNNTPMAASCAAGTAIASFKIRSACGHDQLAPRCAPVACN